MGHQAVLRGAWRMMATFGHAEGNSPTRAPLACLELHGTGTALGDPIEINAVSALLASLAGTNHNAPRGDVRSQAGIT
eukprot:2921542-Pyramimonas_sp.AAC.1